MATFLITTTATATLNDLGGRTFTHPVVAFDLTSEYPMEEIRDSADLRAAIVAGDITATLDGVAITSGALFDAAVEDFLNKRVADAEASIVSLDAQVSALEAGGRRFKKVLGVVDPTAVPPTEVSGDRYALDYQAGTIHANWDGALRGDIVEYDGANWVVSVSTLEGDVVYNDATNNDFARLDDGTPLWEERDGLLEQIATAVPFTPTTNADWDVVPTEVGGALDEAASRIEDLENAVAPTSKKTYTYSAGDNGKLKGSRDIKRTGAITTNITPFIVPITGTLWGLTIASKQGINVTYSVQILKNGVGVLTEVVTTADKKVNAGLALAVVAGDEIRVRFLHTGADVDDLGVEVYGIEA